jgi:hypothetical protein
LPDGESEKFFEIGLDKHVADLPVEAGQELGIFGD